MLKSIYVEDLFLEFQAIAMATKFGLQPQDYSPIISFTTKLSNGESLTQNQANYVLKILEKYKNLSAIAGLDYRDELDNLEWRRPFRVLDLSKKIYVEKDEKGKVWVCLKFPYQLKKEFEEEIGGEISTQKSSYWDHENKIRKLYIYDFNLIQLFEFAKKHNFDIDDSFMIAAGEVEEIWQNSDNILPCCRVGSQGLELDNATEDATNFFNDHKTNNLAHNLILAKSMGFLLKSPQVGSIEKIASSPVNSFWIKNYNTFFSIHNQLKERICIVLDRTTDILSWLQNFVAEADKMLVSREEIKVCFRDNKDSKTGLNDWIKLAGVGGKVEAGKILIFENKPAKWLFKADQDVKILVTNNVYPPTNQMAREWFLNHPCVFYLGDIKPTEYKGNKIVEL